MKKLKKYAKMVKDSKTYLAGVGAMLCGIGTLIVDACKIQDMAGAVEFASGLPTHPGTVMFLGGYGAIGIGHKIEKAKAQTKGLAKAQADANKKAREDELAKAELKGFLKASKKKSKNSK